MTRTKPLFILLYWGTVILLMVGAQLQVLKGALVCPDWPLCFGEFLPLYMTPAFYESLHRFLAVVIGLGSFIWAMMMFRHSGIKVLLPLFLVLLQGLLGWATFVYKLPTLTTVLHLVFSLLFLASLDATRPLQVDEGLKEGWDPRPKDLVGFFLFLLVFQFVLGGVLRKSSLLASCESTMSFWSCWQRQSEIPMAGNLALLHRFLGLVTTFAGFFAFSWLIKHLPRWKWSAAVGLLFMVFQLLLGLMMGRSSSREMIIWHFALGLGLFCVLVYLLAKLRRHEWHFFGGPLPTFLNDLMDLFKPKLTILVVITVLVGVFLAPIQINIIYLVISLFAIWFQAAGALCLNSYIEREPDKYMERTRQRPLPAGRLHPNVALFCGWSLIATGTIVLILTANLLTALLGLASALSYLYLYTPLKLRSPYALYVGAVPGALPTLMGWTTVTGTLAGMGSYLFGVLFLWQIPHFMAISLYRRSDYANARFRTFSQTHSDQFLQINIFVYSLFLMLFNLLPYVWGWRGEGYFISSLVIGALLATWGVSSWKMKGDDNFNSWARSYFFATIFYLPLQLGVLLILR